jgi:hypothetical protein
MRFAQDFFVNELALAFLQSPNRPSAAVPLRWYNIRGREGLFADSRELLFDYDMRQYSIGAETFVVPLSSFLLRLPELMTSVHCYQEQFPAVPIEIDCALNTLSLLQQNNLLIANSCFRYTYR